MSGILTAKTVLITGAAAGIGKATALLCAREGARVVIADVLAEEGARVAEQIRAGHGEALFVLADVAKEADVRHAIEEAVRAYDGIDCAVNNAGIEGQSAETHQCTDENWSRVIAVNLTGLWLCMRHQLPLMLKKGRGSIVNVSSVAGLVGFSGRPAYVAAKHGVVGLTRTAALEYAARGIRVNAVCPGVVRTAMVERVTGGDPELEAEYSSMQPLGRMGTPEEIAESIVWLCSDKSSFVTGHALVADGGMVAE